MEDKEQRQNLESKEKIIQIFSDFMTRITMFEELVDVGSKLLVGFQQALGFLGRPRIDKTSDLAMRIIKAQETKRLNAYVEAGCVKTDDSIQNLNKLNTCHLGLQDHINKARGVVGELECLLDDAAGAIQSTNENWPLLQDEHVNGNMDSFLAKYEKEGKPSLDLSKPEGTDYAAMMAVVYSMLKQEYIMQERIVGSLTLKSSPEELESYCLMWSLRPFVDDDIMLEAWSLVP
ncbi:uncharacterized protein LOC111405445 isoform X1 [Olea europaea var. sylvestris]|uniref:uncharacterized protein LOC111405445 isoform X1 n=1 Tax=Olea europaea var. sylvestris TaxID=158386 RepID=UPI000C1D2206|nr:uncharacterized protein LOC111405445 isoform X1 [Olea europaea var. sylvestris]XP_022890102.1 uncharacterized protein LOC111405445 isoform X1 [Olea europaea var. sylvestris]XP_022890103.1 uncharacterized protein LOC111405445 isoform X1 [Olea europaea var. sylvestris]XP_022890104.1 uncharacterized protein LOC111405445 isoform X1 [Olea europaea var. sylvestris]